MHEFHYQYIKKYDNKARLICQYWQFYENKTDDGYEGFSKDNFSKSKSKFYDK